MSKNHKTIDLSIPHNIEQEKLLLSSVMIENACLDDIAKEIKPKYFYCNKNRLIYETMIALKDSGGIDAQRIISGLETGGNLKEAGGVAYVVDALAQAVTSTRALAHARDIKELWGRRERACLLEKAKQCLEDGKDEELNIILDERLPDAREESAPTIQIDLYTWKDYERDKSQEQKGLETGYKNLDKLLRIPQGAITIIGGRPRHGKTSLMMNLCLNFRRADQNKKFLFFTYEERANKIVTYMNNILSWQNEAAIMRPPMKSVLNSQNLYVVYDPQMTAGKLAETLRAFSLNNDIGAVFVDYIQKIKPDKPRATRYLELKDVSERILEAANVLSIPVIMGAQFGRGEKNTSDGQKVRLDNIRECGDIEQDASLVLGINNKSVEDETAKEEMDLDIKILKNRNGQGAGKASLILNGPYRKIYEV